MVRQNPPLIFPIGERNKHHSFRGVLFSDSKPFFAHPQICSAILMHAVQGDDPPYLWAALTLVGESYVRFHVYLRLLYNGRLPLQ